MAKSKMPKLLKVIQTDSFVKFRHEVARKTEQSGANDPANPGKPKTKEVTSTEEHDITSHDQPLPAFYNALEKLDDVVANVLEVGSAWKKGITIDGFALSYTKTGVRSAVILFHKQIDAISASHPMKTPAFQIDDGKTPEEGRKQCAKKHAEAMDEAIKQAQRYAIGERSQQQLDFKEGDDDEGGEDADKTGKLAGIDDDAGEE